MLSRLMGKSKGDVITLLSDVLIFCFFFLWPTEGRQRRDRSNGKDH